ncbi:MAG: nuclear transport factor 2 family protein [Alphaproteobacteria bacterium]|nr:nuclear transport factor 2 family protein [Alphaproteobacteria bacterium]
MEMNRRDLATAGALAFAATTLIKTGAVAAADDQAAVTEAVDAMRKAQLTQDKAKMEALAADQLSYGHSGAVVQNKAEMVDGVMTRKSKVKSIEYPELKVTVAGPNAIARHLYVSEAETDGKSETTKIGVLEVWQKQDGGWKLLARQGYKLPA